MKINPGSENRNIIPRWRPLAQAAHYGELSPATATRAIDAPFAETPTIPNAQSEAKFAFTVNPGLHTAGDVLSEAVVLGDRDEVVGRAIALVNDGAQATDSLRTLAAYLKTPDASPPVPEAWDRVIAVKRALARMYPRNAIAWVELALAHVNRGQLDASAKELRIALALAPLNRYVVRSSARFAALIGDVSDVRSHIRRHKELLDDPWILSAELALAEVAERTSPHMSRGRKVLRNSRFNAWHLSELASAVGTSEFRAGSDRRAKDFLTDALSNPTENALAQVEWARNSGLKLGSIEGALVNRQRSYEANAMLLASIGNFAEAFDHGVKWQADQPFAPEPAAFLSWIGSIALDNYAASVDAARKGLVASPHDEMLKNNLIFGLANLGRVEEAQSELDQLRPNADHKIELATVTATRGLVAFKHGLIPEGRLNYRSAVQQFDAEKRSDSATVAHLLWAREELLLRTAESVTVAREALGRGDCGEDPLVVRWRRRIIDTTISAGLDAVLRP